MEEKITQEQAVTQQLRIVFKARQAHSKTVEKACGLSSAQLWMLHEVSETHGVKVSQLAKTLVIHPSTCSNMLDKLEAKELISRDRSKTDQRSVHLYVTEEGRQFLINNPSKLTQGKLSIALAQLSPTQLAKLESGLDALVQALRVNDEQADLASP